jgi:hypothetical protein
MITLHYPIVRGGICICLQQAARPCGVCDRQALVAQGARKADKNRFHWGQIVMYDDDRHTNFAERMIVGPDLPSPTSTGHAVLTTDYSCTALSQMSIVPFQSKSGSGIGRSLVVARLITLLQRKKLIEGGDVENLLHMSRCV